MSRQFFRCANTNPTGLLTTKHWFLMCSFVRGVHTSSFYRIAIKIIWCYRCTEDHTEHYNAIQSIKTWIYEVILWHFLELVFWLLKLKNWAHRFIWDSESVAYSYKSESIPKSFTECCLSHCCSVLMFMEQPQNLSVDDTSTSLLLQIHKLKLMNATLQTSHLWNIFCFLDTFSNMFF